MIITAVIFTLVGMGVLPVVRSFIEIVQGLRRLWHELDYFEDQNKRHRKPLLGRGVARLFRFVKGPRVTL